MTKRLHARHAGTHGTFDRGAINGWMKASMAEVLCVHCNAQVKLVVQITKHTNVGCLHNLLVRQLFYLDLNWPLQGSDTLPEMHADMLIWHQLSLLLPVALQGMRSAHHLMPQPRCMRRMYTEKYGQQQQQSVPKQHNGIHLRPGRSGWPQPDPCHV